MGAASPAGPCRLTTDPPGRVFEFHAAALSFKSDRPMGNSRGWVPPIDDDMEVMVENALSEV